ncbi:MAG: hypothetical protein ACLR43_01940 [Faecalibacillus faecis]
MNGEDYYAASSGAIQAQWVKSLSNWYYVDVDGKWLLVIKQLMVRSIILQVVD